MDGELEAALERELGVGLRGARALAGGSINSAWRVDLDGRAPVFVKAHARAPADMFEAEARGLAYLREGLAGCELLRVPAVIAATPGFLILEWIEAGPARVAFDEELGRGLAHLHRSDAALSAFGLDHANYIGSLAQANDARGDWPSFYRELRLAPMLEHAVARGLASTGLRRRFDRLFDQLEELCGDPQPPARVHGDLWAGNACRDERGRPVLFDPAVHAGHREVDLAMMKLFGGFSTRTFAAYDEAFPLAPGWSQRVALYQLYPLLVHLVLFGAGYLGSIEAALGQLV